MTYNEGLAARVRESVSALGLAVDERKMFGGLAFMLDGHMFSGIVGDELMLRLGPEGTARALREANVREMDFTGRPMKGMVFLAPGRMRATTLQGWLERAAGFTRTLPPKA